MVLSYSTPEDHPFANSKPTPPYSNMWPTCLRGQTATGHFESVSVEARAIGIEVGTQYSIRFYDFNDHYGFTIYTPRGNHHLYGKENTPGVWPSHLGTVYPGAKTPASPNSIWESFGTDPWWGCALPPIKMKDPSLPN
jgi:hypothetical protein